MSPIQSSLPATGDPDTLRAEITDTRAELGDTVDALAAKTDVTGRAKAQAAQLRARVAPAVTQAQVYAGKARTAAAGSSARTRIAAGAGVAAVIVLLAARRRRSKRHKTDQAGSHLKQAGEKIKDIFKS